MKKLPQLLISCAAAFLAVGAHAANSSSAATSDGWHITNGGTGFIGVTQSAGQPRAMQRVAGMPAGEATTMIDGRPNANPDAPGWTAAPRDAQRTMGNSSGSAMDARSIAARNPSWGTPD